MDLIIWKKLKKFQFKLFIFICFCIIGISINILERVDYMKKKKELSLYIHIPFCKQKCFYCDFPSYASIDHLREDYVEALCKEINEKGINYKIKSFYRWRNTFIFRYKRNKKIIRSHKQT